MSKFFIINFVIFLCLLKATLEYNLKPKPALRYNTFWNFSRRIFEVNELKKILTDKKVDDVSSVCLSDVSEIFAKENYYHSIQFLDAWSKLPSALLFGQYFSFGAFDECEAAKFFSKSKQKIIKGKYFLVSTYTMSRGHEHFLFSFGVCFPHTCTREDTRNLFNKHFRTPTKLAGLLGKNIDDNNSGEIDDSDKPPMVYTVSLNRDNITNTDFILAYVAIVVIGFFVVLVALSTVYEFVVLNANLEPNLLLKTFSLFTNLKFLLRTDVNDSNHIKCLNGIRVLNLVWNIYGHVYMWSMFRSEVNAFSRKEWMDQWYARILTSANTTVDTFLLLSGTLVAWIGLNKLQNSDGKMSLRHIYIHRLLRLTPPFALTILIASGLFVFMSDGPVWYRYTLDTTSTCRQNWWQGLFYISNYVDINEPCIGHSWYLATDFQLYLLSPFILQSLWKRGNRMVLVLLTLTFLSCYWGFSRAFELQVEGFIFYSLILGEDKYREITYSTHMRMGPWIIGILLGYVLFKTRNKSKILGKSNILLGWILCSALIILMVFGPHRVIVQDRDATTLEAALYESFGRCGWSIAIAWIIFSCHMGYSETINTILSHPLWQPLARLNYSTYIVKTFINIIDLASQKTELHFSDYEMMCQFWSNFGSSTTFAVFLAVSLEFPVLNLEKYFQQRQRHQKYKTIPNI